MMQIALTIPQSKFIYSSAANPAIVGGLGSGKSRAGTMRAIVKLIQDRGCNVAYYMPTYDLLRLRGIVGVEQDLKMIKLNYSVNKSNYTISVVGFGDIIFRSYDNPSRIIAYEVGHSICDELDTLQIDKAAEVWRKISERNRQKTTSGKNTIGLVTTPDQGLSGFVYKKWVSERTAGYALIKAPTTSNPYLPVGYVEQIRANYDERLAEMYISGEFVTLSENKVYHYFNREIHYTDRCILASDNVIYISIDFNIGGCCSTVSVIDNNSPIVVDEFVTHDTHDFINYLAANYHDKTINIYPDSSGDNRHTNASDTDLQIIEQAGHAIHVDRSNPRIRDRINAVNKLLSHNQIKINTNKCQRLTNALENQGYKNGEPEKFAIHPAIDDWVDSFGYFVAQMYPVKKLATHVKIQYGI